MNQPNQAQEKPPTTGRKGQVSTDLPRQYIKKTQYTSMYLYFENNFCGPVLVTKMKKM